MPSRAGGRQPGDAELFATDELVVSAARAVNGDSGMWDRYGDSATLRCALAVSAASGTSPSLNVFVEDTLDGTNWNVIATFAAKTAVGTEAVNVSTPFGDRIRVRWTISGTTPSFTFGVLIASQKAQS